MTEWWTTINRGAAAARLDDSMHWAQFGDDVVLWGDRSANRPPNSRDAGDLALVTQVGSAFTNEHPDATVLVDHGRHLVVDATTAPTASQESHTCWRIEPMPVNRVVVGRAPRVRAAHRDPAIGSVLALLDQSRYEAAIHRFASLFTRHSLSSGFTEAANWASAELTSIGYGVTTNPIAVGAGTSQNVIASRTGNAANRGVVVVTAHLDSINIPGGPMAAAPGADDNASGAAGVLEIGRVLATRLWAHDLRLILFGGEEEGLFGSRQHVAQLSDVERSRIRAVINMDMIARINTVARAVLLEGAQVSSWLIADLAAAASAWTDLEVSTSLSPFASDHVPFIDSGIPAVLTIEGNDSANHDIHTDRDTIATTDATLALEILRMNLAVLAQLLTGNRIPRPASSVVSWGSERIDIFTTGTDSGVYHKAWDGGEWHPVGEQYEFLGRVHGEGT
jgi:Peptidase family M28